MSDREEGGKRKKFARPALSEQDLNDLVPILAEAALREKNPERRWRLFRLGARFHAPARGHPPTMSMENMSNMHYSIEDFLKKYKALPTASEASRPLPATRRLEARIEVTQEVVDRMLKGKPIKSAEQPCCKVCYHKIDCDYLAGTWFHTNVPNDGSHKVEPLVKPS